MASAKKSKDDDLYDRFISTYKKIEDILPSVRNAPDDAGFGWLESQADSPSSRSRLYLCRIMRNYIRHNNDYRKFVLVSEEHVQFLNHVLEDVRSHLTTVNDRMIPTGGKSCFVSEDETIGSALNQMVRMKEDVLYVLKNDETLRGVLDAIDVLKVIRNGSNLSDSEDLKLSDISAVRIPSKRLRFIKAMSEYSEVSEAFRRDSRLEAFIVTDCGTRNGKVLGYIRKDR